MSISARLLRHARRRAGLTQRVLAARSGIPQETVARIERGTISPRLETLDRLLAACGFGLELERRLGVGIDRSQIAERLDLTPAERGRLAAESDRNLQRLRARRA